MIRRLLAAMAIFVFSSCQPAAEESSPQPAAAALPARYDQSVVQPIDTQIFHSSSSLNRAIPGLDDSSVTYCESVNGEAKKYNGVRDSKKYPLASLSKVFLSAWALDKLGPQYRFENKWYIKKISPGLADVYFRANYDPALNIEKMLYAMSLLKAQGVDKIRQLIIDETTRVYLSVLQDPHVELAEVPVSMDKSIENLKIILNSNRWGPQTEAAKNNLARLNITAPNSFSVDQVVYRESRSLSPKNYSQMIEIKSAPLLKYLKDINVNSNNYMADMLFKTLDGEKQFKNFQVNRLGVSVDDLQFFTGSGLPISSMDVRMDNMGTCVSVLKTLKFIHSLSVQLSFKMGQVLLVAGSDNGTFESSQSISFNQSISLKTGRLFDVAALNVAGTAALEEGTLYFSYMAHNFDNNDEAIYKNKRDQILKSILNFYPVRPAYQTVALDNIFF